MFIIQFWGGLGNQMFEYAFYKKMCKVYNRSNVYAHLVDVSIDAVDGDCEYHLERVFGIKLPWATPGHVAKHSNFYPAEGKRYWLYSRVFNLRSRVFGDKASYIKEEDSTLYYPEVFELSPLHSYYLRGIWQNEQYFFDIKDELIADFAFQVRDSRNEALIRELSDTNSVSIHLRNYHDPLIPMMDMQYYEAAINYIQSKVAEPKFYVFSDNPDLAKQLLDGMVECCFVNQNKGKDSYLDMMLMSKCKHNIIANSTFSFWGAYLNQNPEKIVVAPKRALASYSLSNLTAEGWINI